MLILLVRMDVTLYLGVLLNLLILPNAFKSGEHEKSCMFTDSLIVES